MLKIKLLNEIKEHATQGIPNGWFIRTTAYASGFIKRDLLLCTPKTEVRVPISKDFNLSTPKLNHDIPANAAIQNIELHAIDLNLNFQVTSFTTTKGDKRTTLPYIKKAEGQLEDPDYLFCMGLDTPPGYHLVNIETDACVVRDYIDKNRLFAALVLTSKQSQPNSTVVVTMSSKTDDTTIVSTYLLDKASDVITKRYEEFSGFAETEFISFPNRLIRKRSNNQQKTNNDNEQPKQKEAAPKTIKKNKFNNKTKK